MRFVGVDWSGAATGEARHLWVAEVDGDTGRLVALAPSTRTEATERILRVADEDGGVVAGLDFAFSLPAWWLAANDISSVDGLWGDGGRLETWLAACAPPFWGRPGRRRPDSPIERRYRRTELLAPRRPGSPFQIGGAGAVGTGSLRGMPHLARLRAAGIGVWPWDPWTPPVVAEIWPRLALGSIVKSSTSARAAWAAERLQHLGVTAAATVTASGDALDAVAAALRLAADRDRIRSRPADPATELEGWIDGVAEPPADAQSASVTQPAGVAE